MLLRRAGAKERAFEVRVDDRIPFLVGHLEQQVVANDARARDEDVEASELLDRELDHGVHLGAHAHIAGDRQGAYRVRHLASRCFVEVGDRDLRALGRQQTCRGGADPATASGDECDSVFELHSVSVSSATPPSLRGSEAPWRKPSFSATITWGRAKYES